MKRWIVPLPANRTRRNYRGGMLLDQWEGRDRCKDGDRPEDWIASTTPAVNPGLPPVADEGMAFVEDGARRIRLADLFAAQPEHYLGAAHVRQRGPDLGFLVKLLDSAMRLHVQAHPTREFARERLSSRWGKLETYVVLDTRPGCEPYIRLGFQRAPSAAEWRRIVLGQDIAAMDACFDRVPVRPGEVWYVPGGLPHAIGEGLLVLETMEPTDLVVRCEFEREGIVVPPAARFMGRDPDFALRIFDLTSLPVDEVRRRYRVAPRVIRHDAACRIEQLIGPEHTDCFIVLRAVVSAPATISKPAQALVGVVIGGAGEVRAKDQALAVKKGARFLVPAAASEMQVTPAKGDALSIVLVRSGAPAFGRRLERNA